MRKIESAMCAAVKERRYWKSGNTEVNVRYDYLGMIHIEVFLHGNMIWRWNEAEDITEFSLARWNTNTTRSRLNTLGVGVYQKNFAPMYKGEVIDKNKWYKI